MIIIMLRVMVVLLIVLMLIISAEMEFSNVVRGVMMVIRTAAMAAPICVLLNIVET